MWYNCHLPGNMPPIVTEPTVIRCKVNSTVNIKFVAQDPNGDPITFSLLYPRPPGASISTGETHTHTCQPLLCSLKPKSGPLPLFIHVTDDFTVDICQWDSEPAVKGSLQS